EFVNICKQGYQELIYVSICGKGSSTHNNAVIAKNEFYEKYPQYSDFKIHIIDSKTYCLAYGYPVMEAAKKAKRNATSDEIIAYLNDWFDSVLVFLAPYTLEFAKKSGRIGCAAAFMGELIGLRPIILMVDGTTKTIAKVRGDKNVVPELVKLAKEHAVPETPYVVIETMLKEESKDLQASMKKAFGYDCVGVYQAGAAISINAGPKIVAVVVKGQNRKSNQ
ncbi:MAG: DegV family protein, partial [Oscillospiraceae bacterium]